MKGLPISFINVSIILVDQSSIDLSISICPILVDRDTFMKEALSSSSSRSKGFGPRYTR